MTAIGIRQYCECEKCTCNIIVRVPPLPEMASYMRSDGLCVACGEGKCYVENLTDNPRPRSKL